MFYALTPGRRAAQIAGDLAVVAWCVLWVWVGTLIHGIVMRLAVPARQLQQSATDFGAAMNDAGQAVGQVPFAGESLQGEFGRVGAVANEAVAAGVQFETLIGQAALALGIVVALAPALGVALPWLISRVRFARRASAARAFVDSEADLELFALRAMAHQPLPRLAAISSDPVGAVRDGDRRVIHRLAALELRDVGLSPEHLLRRR